MYCIEKQIAYVKSFSPDFVYPQFLSSHTSSSSSPSSFLAVNGNIQNIVHQGFAMIEHHVIDITCYRVIKSNIRLMWYNEVLLTITKSFDHSNQKKCVTP